MDQIYINGMKVHGSKQAIYKLEHYIRKAGAKLEQSFGGKDLYTPARRVDFDRDEKFIGKYRKDWTGRDYERMYNEIQRREREIDEEAERRSRERLERERQELENLMKKRSSPKLYLPPRYPPK